ncbi:hypothetical protein L0663_05045 [Dyadobacter sp. CY107]|uniref:hypothetical protein n=1 Tax=Dyadobacter fanqingshengii TaxID=2906443 RepID=UPI001F3CB5D3|nr:hypothetical protein [Dyadobacter fanqingshengii]MCF2502733.1 hypothetical protein [Dyadobacter fanqingshengii]
MLVRHQYGSGEPASYWYLPVPGELDLIRIFPRWDRGSFYLSCFRSPDQETLEIFTRELQRFDSDMLMLPYSLQNMEVDFTGNDFIISKVGTISTHNTTLLANSSQLIFYTANGFR